MKDIAINILINLYGEDVRKDFEDHLALLEDINNYRRRKRIDIEQQAKSDFLYLADSLCNKYPSIYYYLNEDDYLSYSKWFKEVFIEDYDKALIESEQQNYPSDRELCILRIARDAGEKCISHKSIGRFFKEYKLDIIEQCKFYNEYYGKFKF